MTLGRGTSLIVIAIPEGIVAAADDLLYVFKSGSAVPVEKNVRKIFVSDNIIIGSAQLIFLDEPLPVPIKYKLEPWVAEFINLDSAAPSKNPVAIAAAMYEKMRQTFKPIETMLESGYWKYDEPGDRIVSYIVAGYSQDFKDLHLIELGAEVNADGKRLRYLSITHDTSEPELFFGEHEFLAQAVAGHEPYASIRKQYWFRDVETVSLLFRDAPEALQDAVASITSLIKVEAQFNQNKVGRSVKIAMIDRTKRKTHSGTLP